MSEHMKQDLAAIKALVETPGWRILREGCERDVLNAAFALADNPNMPEAEMRFRIGAIHASRGLINAPQLLAQIIESQLAFDAAEAIAGNPDATNGKMPSPTQEQP